VKACQDEKARRNEKAFREDEGDEKADDGKACLDHGEKACLEDF